MNTQSLTEEEAKREIAEVERETKLPAIDPIRFGLRKLIEELESLKK